MSKETENQLIENWNRLNQALKIIDTLNVNAEGVNLGMSGATRLELMNMLSVYLHATQKRMTGDTGDCSHGFMKGLCMECNKNG